MALIMTSLSVFGRSNHLLRNGSGFFRGPYVVDTGRLSISTTDGLLHYSALTSEAIESASKTPLAEVAASSCLRRAASHAGLVLVLSEKISGPHARPTV
jgi:hypothetical protein